MPDDTCEAARAQVDTVHMRVCCWWWPVCVRETELRRGLCRGGDGDWSTYSVVLPKKPKAKKKVQSEPYNTMIHLELLRLSVSRLFVAFALLTLLG